MNPVGGLEDGSLDVVDIDNIAAEPAIVFHCDESGFEDVPLN
jgi:hypothetical protein